MRALIVFCFVGCVLSSHVVDKELSDEKHFADGEHNPEYDHEAFVGEDEAKTFDQLTPEESKERLSKIFDKVDTDGDGFATEEELSKWVKNVQNRYIHQDTDKQWGDHTVKNELLAWEEYYERTYGFLKEEEYKNELANYEEMIKRDERRWKKADKSGDNALDKDEFAAFLHPEEHDHMKDVVVDETMNDIDKDKDGFITLDEYIHDMWPNQGKEEEPDWVSTEREQFAKYRDLDGDGKMDHAEVRKWVLPEDYDHVTAEAKHLMHEADDDKDEKLSRGEVLEHYDTFVGSQATDYGEVLTRHDEF